jgi:hypothetical protein
MSDLYHGEDYSMTQPDMPITKQTVAIIGSNSILGISVAKGLCSRNYRLLLFDEEGSRAQELAKQICSENLKADVGVAECRHLASWEADVIVIATGFVNIDELSEKIREVSTQKILAVIIKEYNRKEFERVESSFPDSFVVGLIPEDSDPDSVELLTNHPEALQTVQRMVEQAGLNPSFKKR